MEYSNLEFYITRIENSRGCYFYPLYMYPSTKYGGVTLKSNYPAQVTLRVEEFPKLENDLTIRIDEEPLIFTLTPENPDIVIEINQEIQTAEVCSPEEQHVSINVLYVPLVQSIWNRYNKIRIAEIRSSVKFDESLCDEKSFTGTGYFFNPSPISPRDYVEIVPRGSAGKTEGEKPIPFPLPLVVVCPSCGEANNVDLLMKTQVLLRCAGCGGSLSEVLRQK